METQLKQAINIAKPPGMTPKDWALTKARAADIRNKFISGKPWDTELYIGSKEFFQMILDENGSLMVSPKAKLKFAGNANISSWKETLTAKLRRFINNHSFRAAEKVLDLLETIDGNDREVLLLGAYFHMQQRKNSQAWRRLCKLLSLDNKHGQAYFLRASLLNDVGRLQDALEDINLCLTYARSASAPVVLKSRILSRQGKNEEAIKALKNVLEARFSETVAVELAALYTKNGELKNTYAVWKKMVSANGNNAEWHFQAGAAAKALNLEVEAWNHLYRAQMMGHTQARRTWVKLKADSSRFSRTAA